MDINQNNSQKNTFSGGMDLDTSVSALSSDKYRIARNVHYVTDKDSNSGELRMINGVQMSPAAKSRYTDKRIIGTASVQDWGVIVYVDSDSCWGVDKFKNPYENSVPTTTSTKDFTFTPVVLGVDESIGNNYTNKISCLLNYESEDNIKLYIADGEHYLLTINIMEKYPIPTTIGLLESIPRVSLDSPKIKAIVSGSIKNPVVQYAYQVYNKYGQQSEMSPITRLIYLPKDPVNYTLDGKSVTGVAPEQTTNCGVQLQLPVKYVPGIFDKLKLYRISYNMNGQNPNVELIIDGDISGIESYVIDSGDDALATLTLEEFNSISGQHIIPRVVERKDGLLFAANIKEPVFSLEGFDKFDARCYSFDPYTKKTHLYNYYTDNHDDYTYDNISSVPTSHDCYNKYTDPNTPMYDHNKEDLQSQADSGILDRFTLDGEYYGGSGTAISWKFIITELIGDSSLTCYNDSYGNTGTTTNTISLNQELSKVSKNDIYVHYITSEGLLTNCTQFNLSDYYEGDSLYMNYSDPMTSSIFKSLRRGEVYRFGIVLYDQHGIASPVKWIQDIRTPNVSWRGFETFSSHGANRNYTEGDYLSVNLPDCAYDLGVRPLGIEFTIDPGRLPKGCTGYEIVRCNRTFSDMATISQGVVSRPIKTIHNPNYKGFVTSGDGNSLQDGSLQSNEPFTPTGFLTTARYWAGLCTGDWSGFYDGNWPNGYARCGGLSQYDYDDSSGKKKEADNLDNSDIFQFVSPEVVYQKDSFKTLITDVQLKLMTEKYVFGSDGGPNKDQSTDPRYVITPSASNLNLRILEEFSNNDSDGKYPSHYAFDVKNKKWSSGSEGDISSKNLIRAGINQRYQIMMDYGFTPIYFYRTRADHAQKYAKSSNIVKTSYEYVKLMAGYNSMSFAKKQRVPIINTKPSGENNGNINTVESVRWPIIAAGVATEIKLYEQSNSVWCRQHMENCPAADFFMVLGNAARDTQPIERSVQNGTSVSQVAFPDDMNWDDFATSSTKDDKTTWNLSYPDKITSIGDCNYCNWTTNGCFNISFDTMKWDVSHHDITNFTRGDNAADQSINGPAGRCMLIKVDNLWDNNVASSFFIDASTYYANTESFLLTDTIGCSQILQRAKKYRPYEHFKSVADLIETSPQETQVEIERTGLVSQDTNVPFYRNSILGTYVCNLRKKCTPYGGSSQQSKVLDNYYSYGNYKRLNGKQSTIQIFNGDCYIQPFEYTSLHKYYNNETVYQVVTNINYSIPVETSYNLAFTYGEEPSRSILDNSQGAEYNASSYIQAEPANVANRWVQIKPEYSYNTVYSTNSTSRVFTAYDPENKDEEFSYRCRYSNAKTANEEIDSWCKFMPSNYIDVDGKFGEITELRTFRNYLFYWQEQAFGRFSVNERSQVVDQNNMALALGSGGVLDRYDYITECAGMKINQLVDTITPSNIYWWDYDNHIIWSSDGQAAVPLSKLKFIQSLLNTYADDDHMLGNPSIAYDNQSNDVIMRLINDDVKMSIVYNEQAAQFVALDDVDPKYAVSFNNCLYLASYSGLYRWNASNGQVYGFDDTDQLWQLYPTVNYVVNAKPEFVKTFDNAEFAGRFYEGDVTPLNIRFKTPLKQESSINGDSITSREYSFRYAVPRNGESAYGDRMRGKFMECELTSCSSSTDFSLQYVLNTFRISCS